MEESFLCSAYSPSHASPCFILLLTLIRDESVVDNEGLGKKSSKRCCIFHKQRPFGESSTDSSDDDDYDEEGQAKKIAHKKTHGIAGGAAKKPTPDHLRFHA